MFTVIGIQIEYQPNNVIGLYCTKLTLNKKGVIKKRCSFDVKI